MYESMLFLFVEHAFDVGDLLEVELLTYRVSTPSAAAVRRPADSGACEVCLTALRLSTAHLHRTESRTQVKKIDLLYTTLIKSTGERVYYPNTRLITLPVVNLTRTTARSEKFVISVDVGAATTAAREAILVRPCLVARAAARWQQPRVAHAPLVACWHQPMPCRRGHAHAHARCGCRPRSRSTTRTTRRTSTRVPLSTS
jgi:hypothetical protein